MDQWQEHVRIEINSATDSLRLLDIMQSLSSMEVTDLIPYDIGIDLFNLIDTKNE
jgi:hypothetical protein